MKGDYGEGRNLKGVKKRNIINYKRPLESGLYSLGRQNSEILEFNLLGNFHKVCRRNEIFFLCDSKI